LENYLAVYDATAVARLKKAGAIIIGKTNLDAWAHGASGENSDFGPTKNPWDPQRVPGGSSSGSAAATSAGMCLAALGTDTGGSIRLPASFCNLTGLKPTYGRVSRYGVVAMASSFDSIGHLTRTAADAALILSVTAGPDNHDATMPPVPVGGYLKDINKKPDGIKIGLVKQFTSGKIDSPVKGLFNQAVREMEKIGATVREVSLPHCEAAVPAYYVLVPSEISSNLARYDGIRYGHDRDRFGAEAIRRIMVGTYSLSSGYYDAYYRRAMQVRQLVINDLDQAFQKVDILLTPVSPVLPFRLGEKSGDPLSMYLMDIFTSLVNLAGLPGLSIPIGFAEGLPVGAQLIGPQFAETRLLQTGYAYQKITDWHQKRSLQEESPAESGDQ
jgi:aspartyl-tRNA(Asn)/glutamyl-tRNA(Gln) amidotransferase subunit A